MARFYLSGVPGYMVWSQDALDERKLLKQISTSHQIEGQVFEQKYERERRFWQHLLGWATG